MAMEHFEQLLAKRKTMLTGEYNSDIAMTLQADTLWEDLPKPEDASDLTQLYARLKEMAIAHETAASSLYQNENLAQVILHGLEWVYVHRYQEQTPVYGNWWNWEIGAPLALLDTLILMQPYIPADRLAAYLRAVDRCVPSPEHFLDTVQDEPCLSTGANRVWKSKVYLLSALLKGDAAGMAAGRDALSPVFQYTVEGDGFYEDGSFIQHERYPYTGGYGKSLIKELADLHYFLSDSPWELHEDHANTLYRWVEDAFAPLMYRGLMADMASGREISRDYHQNHESGRTIIGAVQRLAEAAQSATAERLKQIAQNMVTPQDDLRISKVFAQMDRAIHQRTGFAFGISMCSNRIFPYESINNENLHSWYTAHGMTYLYNSDLGQYSDGFWPTVNPYRLAGTTVSTVPRSEGYGRYTLSSKSFVGGTVLNQQYGAVGMELEEAGEYSAKKSWFLFDEEIVALGSGICATEGVGVETIIENRMLNADNNNAITVDPRWIHLQGNVPGADIGYVFPSPTPVQYIREQRTGKWSDINRKGPSDELKRDYFTLWFDHGKEPKDSDYTYVLLPGQSASEVANYASAPSIDIVELSTSVHAVWNTKLQLFGAHFWEDQKLTAGPITCNRKASVMLKINSDTLDISIADPTQENESSITIELAESASGIVTQDERIKIVQLVPHIVFEVLTDEAKGRSSQVTFRK